MLGQQPVLSTNFCIVYLSIYWLKLHFFLVVLSNNHFICSWLWGIAICPGHSLVVLLLVFLGRIHTTAVRWWPITRPVGVEGYGWVSPSLLHMIFCSRKLVWPSSHSSVMYQERKSRSCNVSWGLNLKVLKHHFCYITSCSVKDIFSKPIFIFENIYEWFYMKKICLIMSPDLSTGEQSINVKIAKIPLQKDCTQRWEDLF